MKTILLIYIVSYILIAQIRAEDTAIKTFSCQSSYSIFDPNFQQGDEIFIDVYVSDKEYLDVKVSQSFGPEYDVFTNKKYFIDESRTSITARNNKESYLSMVFLGSNNWGLYLKPDGGVKPDFLPTDIEVLCKQIDFSTI